MSFHRNESSESSSNLRQAKHPWMGPPILALLIGINKYTSQKYSSLKGAVPDADLFEKFLKERLNVPDADIINLRDEQASRASIISAFESLRDCPKYEKNKAAIIIFYAGHGAQKDKPTAWQDWDTRNGRIEMLCPSDIGCPVNGKECEGIPDRSISALLNQISKVKSNNITLILDCCNSAGINRGRDTIRRILDPPPFENDTDHELLSSESDTKGTRGIGIADGFAGTFDASHVLLAACGSDQVAREDSITKQGIFTDCFLKILGDEDINTLTYTSLIHKMDLKMPQSQTPHCEGRGTNRRLFYEPMPGVDTSFIRANCDSETSEIVLKAGAAQGITVGSRMAVHAYNFVETVTASDTLNPRRGYLTVHKVNDFDSVLKVPSDPEKFPFSDFPGGLFYCMEQWASLKIAVYCKDRIQWLETLFPPEERDQSITIVDKKETCDLELTVIGEKVHFDCHQIHALVKPHILTRIRHTLDVDNTSAIRDVVKSALHFYHHLTRSNPDLKSDWRGTRMELKKLKAELVTVPETFDLAQVFTPIGENLIEKEPATVVVDSTAKLGMTIFNQSKSLAFYPYLFYFDPTDLTIDYWYMSPQAGAGPGNVDAPLPANSKLTLGHGGGGVPPWIFRLREGDKKDVGFFKLFLSTVHADFSSILQESPFKTDRPRAGEKAQLLVHEFWATQLVTVIQVDS